MIINFACHDCTKLGFSKLQKKLRIAASCYIELERIGILFQILHLHVIPDELIQFF